MPHEQEGPGGDGSLSSMHFFGNHRLQGLNVAQRNGHDSSKLFGEEPADGGVLSCQGLGLGVLLNQQNSV